ncbi:MAG TPA: hypothetical protein PKE37_17140 [Thiomonas arsenitoxydans]|uniref:hypothetical protein n=1 Tax=Thiomonas arsenitoxydans (strain DSM 22701 / CIP 110005 / 3As) TaxID=426114 RepID=UPI002C847C69|nr:hypothetical protein [Thiomonas arsenitoxydans]HML83478.1 hypothetical protein [Thiomonas arsenitoxydans]
MNKLTVTVAAFVLSLSPFPALAQENAEALVASMRKADMSYKELMTIMGRSIGMMQEGVLTQNRELVEQGANIIFTHPAPNHSPWSIMPQADQAGFKEALLAYDKILDIHTQDILKGSRGKDWFAAGAALTELQTACISCHLQWKDKAQKLPAQD